MTSTSQIPLQSDISIIVPVYNSQETLKATLDSLVKQSLKNIEIICVNDGSTDNSEEILNNYHKRYPQVKVVNTENQGPFSARSKGIELARGEYIGFCDADDTVDPRMFEKLYKTAHNSDSGMALCAFYRKDKANILSVEMNRNVGKFDVSYDSGWLASLNTAVWNKIIRTDIAKNHLELALNPRISEDALFLLSIYPNIKKISFLSEPLYNYYVNNSNAMTSVSLTDIEVIIESWKEGRSYLLQKSKESFLDVFDLAAFIHLGISIPLVLIKSNSKEFKSCIRLLNKALESYFPKYKKNRFFSLSYILKNKSFMLLPFFAYLSKRGHILMPLLKIYNQITLKLGRDLKW